MKNFVPKPQCIFLVAAMERALIFLILVSTTVGHVTTSQETTTVEVKDIANQFDKYELPKSNINPEVQQTTSHSDTKNAPTNRDFSENVYNTDSIQQNGLRLPGIQANEALENEKNNLRRKLSENARYDAPSVYLEDVIYALKSQNWTTEEKPCLNATLHLLRSLQNFTLWSVWNWDSVSSQPQGLLFGNRYELGNFDECMNTPWASTHPEIRTQYCLAEVVLETDKPVKRRIDKPLEPYESALDYIMRNKSSIHRPLNELSWGGCVPVSCGPRAVERLMATLLARSHLGVAGMRARIAVTEPCQRQDQPRQFDALFYSFLIFALILVSVSLICTYLNCKRKPEIRSLKNNIIKAFCLKENTKSLLQMKKEGAEVLYGIRFLTIVFIVMDHQVGIFNAGPIINGLQVDQAALSVAGMFVLHDDLFVDTFFVLSGFLVANGFVRIKDKPLFNPILLVIKRYIRLAVAFAIMIFFYAAWYPYMGSGPVWNRSIVAESDPCKKNWWLSLLMVSNYVDSENMCIVTSWYIPCDFHFFVVAVLLFWLYKHCPRLALTCTGVLTVGSVLAPGIINYLRELPAVQLFTYDFVKNPRASEQFHVVYIKSHTRATAYIVGIVAGCVFTHYRDTGDWKRISKKWSVIGTVAGFFTMTAVMLVGATYLWRSYHPVEGALYAALNRPIWACGVILIILCCCLGRVPYVEEFLTWYPWVPLSRLSYGLYLTHTVLITRNVMVTRSPQQNDYLNLLTSAAGVVVLGCAAALIIWLFAEAPINNLFTVLVNSRMKSLTPKDEPKEPQPKVAAVIARPGHSGHLHSNLPVTIEISSKM
ncbi:nose resistant to fluoxetine protein 6-like [Pectinophora gossypiella]|uniref:nose resistant to fluoxetine protein 6-like n=1 Tax=Pectinophora gossypiella TaxID=13191 RepID=UPI00214E330C|nr:nose resistant to fluoxetine protein 6-like [Pectinophora gossypiella]